MVTEVRLSSLSSLKRVLLTILLTGLLAACGGGTPTNIDYRDYDAVNDREYIYSKKYYDDDDNFYLRGKYIGGREYLTIGYDSSEWLFINYVTIRFEHSSKKYRVSFSNPVRDVRYGGNIREFDTFRTSSGNVAKIVSILKKRSKEGLDTKIFIRGDGSEYYDTGEILIKAGDYSLPGFFIHKGDPTPVGN